MRGNDDDPKISNATHTAQLENLESRLESAQQERESVDQERREIIQVRFIQFGRTYIYVSKNSSLTGMLVFWVFYLMER